MEIVAATQYVNFVYGKLTNGGVIKLWSMFDQYGGHRGATFVAITTIEVVGSEDCLQLTNEELSDYIQYLHPRTMRGVP